MGPAELLDYEPDSVGALILEEGLQSAHVAIVARAMEIPLVARVPGLLLYVEPGDRLFVDGDKGKIVVHPGSKLIAEYKAKVKSYQETVSRINAIKDRPAVTKDGVRISLSLNAGLPMDVDRIEEVGADGVGLYRTEIPFMLETSLPDVKNQCALYKDILGKAKGQPVIFRTLDIGGDKLLPYLDMPRAENPAMGWRAIRISLDRPGLLRTQIRALLQAAAGQNLSVMIPMVTTIDEFRQARKIINLEIQRLNRMDEQLPKTIKVGVMLEVPSLAYELKTLLPEVDFVSIGTNDLIQFFFAVDRSNIMLTNLYDPLSEGFLTFLSDIVVACEREKVPLQLCGELASTPLEAMVLIGLGFRSLSMTAASIGRVKLMIESLDIDKFCVYLQRLLQRSSHNIRHACQTYAQDHGLVL